MEPTAGLLSDYFSEKFGADKGSVVLTRLGRGSHGQGFAVEYTAGGRRKRSIVKKLDGSVGLGHDYPSDRAAVFLLAMENYGRIPSHARAVDVLSYSKDKGVFSIAGGSEYYLVMDEARGTSYFRDLGDMRTKKSLDGPDRVRIRALAGYLAKLHTKKKEAPRLYYRKLRDTIGHGECLMGVLDTYENAEFTSLAEMAAIERGCVGWRERLKPMHGRLARIHGDFHPGNILFRRAGAFRLLDRSRGEYGEPADDVTALCINYIFFSLINHGKMAGAYEEAIRLFHDEYISATCDKGVLEASGLFYAFRGVVVANPLFYPDVTEEVRSKIFAFVHGVLSMDRFDPSSVNELIGKGARLRRRIR